MTSHICKPCTWKNVNTVERINISYLNVWPVDTGQRLGLRHCLCRARYISAPSTKQRMKLPSPFSRSKRMGLQILEFRKQEFKKVLRTFMNAHFITFNIQDLLIQPKILLLSLLLLLCAFRLFIK